MTVKWKHDKLGSFAFRFAYGWTRTVTRTGFNAFAYKGFSDRPTGKYELFIGADDEKDTPSPAMIDVALKTLADPAAMVALVINALWEDLNGSGPDSGMWWHGNLNDVTDRIRSEGYPLKKAQKARLDGPSDLLLWLRLSAITIRKARHKVTTAINPATGKRIKLDRVYPAHPPIAELHFSTPFEQEHSLGVLTNGSVILGIGYSTDADLFLTKQRQSGPK